MPQLFMRAMIASSVAFFFVSISASSQPARPQDVCPRIISGDGPRSADIPKAHAPGASYSHARIDALWSALNEGPEERIYLERLERALPIAAQMTAQERIAFTERCLRQMNSIIYEMPRFLLDQLLKTKAEDPINGLNSDQLHKLFAEFDTQALVMYFANRRDRFLPALTSGQISHLKSIYINRQPLVMRDWGGVFDLSEAEKITVFLNVAREQGRMTLNESRFGGLSALGDSRGGYAPIKLPPSAERRVLLTAFAAESLAILRDGTLKHIPGIGPDTPLVAPPGLPSIRATVEQIASMHPQLIRPGDAEIMWDQVKNIEVGFKILLEMEKMALRGEAQPKNSLEVLSSALGFNLREVDLSKFRQRQINSFYELSLDLSANLDRPAFAGLPIDRAIWEAQNLPRFLRLLASLRDLSHLYGNSQSSWDRIINEINLRNGVRPENLEDLQRTSRAALMRALERTFNESNVKIVPAELEGLYKRWGSIEPVLTLIARFQGNSNWKAEIPILGKVLRAVLGDRYSKFKYQGDPSDPNDQLMAKNQLRMLRTDSARRNWVKNRTRIDLFDPNASPSESEDNPLRRARTIIQTNLLPNLQRANPQRFGESSVLQGAEKEKLIEIVAGHKESPSPREVSKILQTGLATIEHTLLQILAETNDVILMRKLTGYLKGNVGAFQFQNQTAADLSAIISIISPQKKGELAAVFTTTFDDPKLLLTIGDLVDTSSCQNYKTGSMIETLLGYVVDAGVKGLISYVLKAEHFAQVEVFATLIEALKMKASGERVEIEGALDPNRSVVALKISKPGFPTVSLETRPLNKAQLRTIIKLGQTADGGPGVLYERPYEQTHPARVVIENHAKEIKKEIGHEIGGRTDADITVPESRNIPGGVYTDAGGGPQKSLYHIRHENSFF